MSYLDAPSTMIARPKGHILTHSTNTIATPCHFRIVHSGNPSGRLNGTARGATDSIYGRVETEKIPPLACIFLVIYRRGRRRTESLRPSPRNHRARPERPAGRIDERQGPVCNAVKRCADRGVPSAQSGCGRRLMTMPEQAPAES